MNKYKIIRLGEPNFLTRAAVCECCGICKMSKILNLSSSVLRDAKEGDIIYEYRDKEDIMSVAYSVNKNMQFFLTPNSDYRFRTFAEEHLTWQEKMRMNVAMRRALRKRKMWPGLSFENNLRLLVSSQYANGL